ncbi:ankyrin repeat domain-containing protein [Candidatus Proelusimicrobium volucris]|uniref:ankyrin repeat domain-containing protein n=1 Tax=Candidatus Proelusimicrobium volucris TaxID=3416225 RepID=UPI003D0FD39E
MKGNLLLAIFILFFSLFTTASCFAGEAKKQANFNSVNWKNVTVAEIQRLIKNGAEVNAKNSFGWTPLMLAIFNPNPEIKRTLIGYGANTKIRNKIMDTALIRA